MSLFNCDNLVFIKQIFQVQYETDETVVSGEERRGGPYKTATIIGWGGDAKLCKDSIICHCAQTA